MTIDFHAEANRHSYTTRGAHEDWRQAIRAAVDPAGKRVADIGCGGGIYAAAWTDLGAGWVTGVDFSAEMLKAAAEKNAGSPQVSFRQGDACATGLAADSIDIVHERALVHHLADRPACFREAFRILVPGGLYIVQDRTPEDVALPGAPEHVRGYFFELFPRLLAVEAGRRPARATVSDELRHSGFVDLRSETLWETRAVHADAAALAADLRARTGRSILHELDDAELDRLVRHVLAKVPATGPLPEGDRWTLWIARKPG